MATSADERANTAEHTSSPTSGVSSQSRRSVAPHAVICRLTGEVAGRLAAIEAQSNRPPWSERLFANEFQNTCSLTYGARLEGEIVGFLISHAVVDEAHIVNFAVLPERRRAGVGYALIAHALRDLHLRGIRWVTLEVRKSNTAARTLYDSLGFGEVGLRAGYYPDNQEDAIVMSLNIRQFIDSFGAEAPALAV